MEKAFIPEVGYQVAEIEIVYRPVKNTVHFPPVNSSHLSYKTFLHSWDKDKIQLIEQFKVMFLNHGLKVLGIFTLSSGGMTSCTVDRRILFAAALKAGATRLILAHNHPSGTLMPSDADKELTNSIVKSAKLLDISIVDHIIVTTESYYSFSDHGLL